jgi:hypothetical protein
MSYTSYITLIHEENLAEPLKVDVGSPEETAVRVSEVFNKAALGCMKAKFDVQVAGGVGVNAYGTLTPNSVVDGDTCVIGSQTFTAKNAPSGNNQYKVGLSDLATMTALVAKVNAHPSLILTATASVAALTSVVTVTCVQPGLIGNYIPLTGSARITASGAALAHGADYVPAVCHCGI